MAEGLKALVLKVEPEPEKPNKSRVLPMSDIGFFVVHGVMLMAEI